VLEAGGGASFAEGLGPVAGAVVGHDASDSDAEASVVGQGRRQEGDRALLLLVGQDLAEGDAGIVVDADVDELPAAAARAGDAGALAGDAVAGSVEAAKLLDVDVDESSGRPVLVADRRLGRLQVPDPAQTCTAQDAADRGRRDPGLLGDLLARPALGGAAR
jgi:hypothetical protein